MLCNISIALTWFLQQTSWFLHPFNFFTPIFALSSLIRDYAIFPGVGTVVIICNMTFNSTSVRYLNFIGNGRHWLSSLIYPAKDRGPESLFPWQQLVRLLCHAAWYWWRWRKGCKTSSISSYTTWLSLPFSLIFPRCSRSPVLSVYSPPCAKEALALWPWAPTSELYP